MLKAFGWTMISVPYYDWYGMDNPNIKVRARPGENTRVRRGCDICIKERRPDLRTHTMQNGANGAEHFFQFPAHVPCSPYFSLCLLCWAEVLTFRHRGALSGPIIAPF